MRQGFGGEEVQGAGGGVAQQAVEYGQVVAQGFAAGSAGDHDEVVPAAGQFPGAGLMGVEGVDPLPVQGSGEGGVQVVREGGGLRLPGRDGFPGDHICRDLGSVAPAGEQGLHGEFG